MINSMTGYGDAESQLDGVTYTVEIRAVNNRYFKSIVKLPEPVAFLEGNIEALLQKNLSRGTINYILRLKSVTEDLLFAINENVLKTYLEKLNKAAVSTGIKCTIDAGNLLTLPGILESVSPDEEKAEKLRNFILELSQQAIERLKQMRAAEGVELRTDLDNQCKAIKQSLDKIRMRKDTVIQEYHEKLKKRISELTADAKLHLDEETLTREVAIFADRSDISEELSRLESHLKQFVESYEGNNQTGRRLDFISQEMLREANTIASKASDIEISHCVVEIKCRIDRIKEQVQNIE